MRTGREAAVYWDASAVLSALFQDRYSAEALAWSRRPGAHLLSSLAWAEVHAVIARVERERALAGVLVAAAREAVDSGPWRLLNITPAWESAEILAAKWPLRGADLWHLSAAKTLQDELPELVLLTFDSRLKSAALGEGLDAGPPTGIS